MARRGANLAGLAALGALGYKLAQGKGKTTASGESKASMPTGDDQYDENVKQYMDDTYNPDVKQYMDDTVNPDVKQRVKSSGSSKSPAAPKKPFSMTSDTIDSNVKQRKSEMSRENEAKIRETGGPRGTRYLPKSETDAPASKSPVAQPKMRTREEMINAIPTDAGKYAPVSGERVTGSELGRNISNTLNATAGLSVPGFVGRETAKQFGARAAARRADEGLSDAEVTDLMRRRALSEMDTTGGAIGYKKGGAVKAKPVKKMASGGAAKPAAKGWGQARGARGAKYY